MTIKISKDCMVCAKNCPSNAITGEKGKVHTINEDKCIKCGACLDVCSTKYNAVIKLTGKNGVPANG